MKRDEGIRISGNQDIRRMRRNLCLVSCVLCLLFLPHTAHSLTNPYYEQNIVYTDIYHAPWFTYSYNGHNYLVSPLVDAGENNELLRHRVTVDFNATSGGVNVSMGHYSANDFATVIGTSYRYTAFTNAISGKEIQISTQYRSERYAWIILEVSGNAVVTKINHYYWVGFNTEYGHEARVFNFGGSYLPYRILLPKNYDSSVNKKYPLVVSCPGSPSVGKDNEIQMAMTIMGRYLFERYYDNEEFQAISIVPQPPDVGTATQIPAPYYPKGTLGAPEPVYHPYIMSVYKNGFYAKAVKALINELLLNPDLKIDPNRIYYTGNSLGGAASYEMMKEAPELWAAVWPLEGWAIGLPYEDYTGLPETDPLIVRLKQEVAIYKSIPIQIGTGGDDSMRFGGTLVCDEINSQGGACTHYIFPGVSHAGAAGSAYTNLDQMRWFFSQIKHTGIMGDINSDGKVTAYDAALTAQAVVGLITLSTEQRQKAEVSGDGQVTAYDSALISQKSVGLIDKFPVEQ